jgi:hypothetical protein
LTDTDGMTDTELGGGAEDRMPEKKGTTRFRKVWDQSRGLYLKINLKTGNVVATQRPDSSIWRKLPKQKKKKLARY